MKRILTILLVLLLSLFALTSCDMLFDFEMSNEDLGLPCVHEYDKAVTDPTCTAAGFTTYTCKHCGDTYTGDETAVVAHNYANGACTVCGAVDPNASLKDEDLQLAYEQVHQEAKKVPATTLSNYELPLEAVVLNKRYTVVWEIIGTDKVVLKDGTVIVPEPGEAAINYTIKFTVTNEKGESLSREYNKVVPAFQFNTFADYVEAENGSPLILSGVVTGVFSKSTGSKINGLYVQDLNNDGGYYVYSLSEDVYETIKPGMTVSIKGNKDNYSGTYEVVDAAVTVIDSTIKPVVPVDYTELLNNAEALTDKALVEKQALLVTIKGVTILEAGDNGYYYFQAGAHKVYLRISSSNNACTSADLEAIKAIHAANYGNTADVTGTITIYNKAFYLSPVSADAFTNIKTVEKTDAEKVTIDLDALEVKDSLIADTVLDLLLSGKNYGTNLAWTSDSEYAVVEGGSLKVTIPATPTTVTLTVVGTLGEASETRTFTINLSKPTVEPVDPVVGTPYKFGMIQGNLNNTLYYLDGAMNGFYMNTVEDVAAAADVYLEATEGGYYLYCYIDGVKTYINMVVNDTHVNGAFEATASTVYTYNTEKQTVIAVVNGEDYWFGTRNDKTYTTVGPVKVSYNGFYCQFYASEGGNTGGGDTPVIPPVEDDELTVVDPVVDTEYKFGMVQGNLNDGKVYFLDGAMNGYYMNTVTDPANAVGVYLEATEGGYYLYCYIDGVKTYINMVVNGTHVNGAFEATASTVYTYNTEKQTVIAVVNGEDYWFGTRNDKTYTTVGPVKVSYNGFYCQFYGVSAGGDTPVVPPHEHSYESAVTAPTCTEAGYTTYTCSCGDSYKADEVPATGHNYVDGVCSACGANAPDPNANVADFDSFTKGDGKDTSYVDRTNADGWILTFGRCDEQTAFGVDYDQIIIDGSAEKLGTLTSVLLSGGIKQLSFGYGYAFSEANGVSIKINIKDADGKVLATTDCVNTTLAKGVAAEFVWVLDTPITGDFVIEIVNNCPTGSATGNKDRFSLWNLTWTGNAGSVEPPHEHSYEAVVTAPTCTEAGYTTYTCSCGDSYTADEVPATGHKYEAVVTAPTCTEAGYTTYTCSCGDSYTADEVPATGHVTDNDYVFDATADLEEMAAGTKADGETLVIGTNGFFTIHFSAKTKIDGSNKEFADGYIATQRLNMGGKTEFKTDYVKNAIEFNADGSCTVTIWWVCGGDDREIDLFDANGNTLNTTAEGCTKNSLYISTFEITEAGKYYIGSDAGSNYYFKVEVATNYTNPVVTAPTCTEAGYTTHTCPDCGETYVTDEVAALGHSYVDGVCSVCGAEDPNYVPPTPAFPGSGTQDDPYVLSQPGDYTCAFAGNYNYVWYQLSARTGGYMTISSEYADAWLMIGTDAYNTLNSGMYGPSITVYVPAGTPCYFGVGTNSDEAADVPFTVSFEAFTSEPFDHIVGSWKGEITPFWSAVNVTIRVDENGLGTIVEDGGYYTDTFEITFILVDGDKVTFFATNEYGNAPSVTEFTYVAESDSLVTDGGALTRYDGSDEPVVDPNVSYDTVIVIGSNVLYFSADEIAADTATRKLTISVAGTYQLAAGNLFVRQIVDANGNALTQNDDYSYTFAEGDYVVTFSMLSMFGIQADTACDLVVKEPADIGGGEGGDGGDEYPELVVDELKESLAGTYTFDGYNVMLMTSYELGLYLANVYDSGLSYDLYFTYDVITNNDGSYTLNLTYCPREGVEVNPDMVDTVLGYNIVIGGSGETPDVCEHNYVDGVCTLCGAVDPDYVPAECAHNSTSISSADPTCTVDGYYTVTCDECGEVVYSETTPATGHSFVDGACSVCGEAEAVECNHNYETPYWHPEMQDATCSSTGVAVYECTLCGDIKTEEIPVNPEAHTWDYENYEVIVPADCATMTNGINKYTCSGCGATEENESYAMHSLVETVVDPTCTVDGSYYAQCSVCGYEESNVIYAEGHFNWEVTCGNSGECMNCGETFTMEHNFTFGPATCTQPAYCSNCWQYVGEPLGHTVVDCVCTVCDEVVHGDVVHFDAIDPACHYNGNIEYWVCYDCECVWADEALTQVTNIKNVVLPATGEGNLVHMEAIAPACHYDGQIEHWICYTCEQVWADEALTQVTNIKNVVLPATGEGNLVHMEAIAPACHYDGQIEHWICYTCEQVWADEALTQVTNIKNVVLPAVGGEVTHVPAVDPTCEADGNIEYWYCATCEQVWQDEALTQLTNFMNVKLAGGHDWVAPTCTVAGYCANCDAEGEAALGHTGYEADYKCDTCSEVLLPEDGTALTIPQALVIAELAGTSYTTQKYYITGIIKNVYNTQYGNLYLVDADGNEICIYGLYSYDGSVRYDAMEYKPVAGDELTVYTILGMYGSTKQGKDAWMDEVVAHEHTASAEATCLVAATCSLCGITMQEALGHTEANASGNCDRCGATLSGVAQYQLVTDAADFTSGTYIIVNKSKSVAMDAYSSGWITVSNVAATDGVITGCDAVWTITVDGSSVTITDRNGVTIAPKSGNTNGITSGSYNWEFTFSNGDITFNGVGSDTTMLACNTGSSNKIRAYKDTTVSGNPSTYPSTFQVYKLV